MSNLEDLLSLPTYLTYDDVLLLPNYSEITPPETELKVRLGSLHLQVPILSAPMDTVTEKEMLIALGQQGALGVIHRNLSISEQALQLKEALETGIQAAAAVGVGADLAKRVEQLVSVGAHQICLDSAHGHTKNVIEAVHYIKKAAPRVCLIAGNVATYEGAYALFEAGADIVKVGMGPGSICTTRIKSGMGVPQLSAIVEAARAARDFDRPLIADGGIKTSGDIVKALAAGASAVMLGSLLAGTDEAPGELVEVNGKKYKAYRGMGSVKSMVLGSAARYGQEYREGQTSKLIPEGIEGFIGYRGSVKDHLHQLLGGLRAGMAYLGSRTIDELQTKARFIRISQAGVLESHPHSVLSL